MGRGGCRGVSDFCSCIGGLLCCVSFDGMSSICISGLMSRKGLCLFRVCGGSFSPYDGNAPGVRALC